MNKEEKVAFVDSLSEKLNDANYLYLADISGLNADEDSKLRRLCFENGVKLQVVKNILLKKAMSKSEKDFGEMEDILTGPTSLMTSGTINAAAKLIKIFRKENDKPILKGAFIDSGIFIGDQELDSLAKLKSKEELIAEVIAILQSPIKTVIGSLQSAENKLAGIVKTLGDRPETTEDKEETTTAEETKEEPTAEQHAEKTEVEAEPKAQTATEQPAEEKKEDTSEDKTEEETPEAKEEQTEDTDKSENKD
ncbi:MAG: 50S ribosomal protein L10 [Bacteroidetes bacterium]|nr:50S ribosomal protein L10 [Bacteroidia bacterium]PCH67300.1 MAG: 50S ribosomal protein L10 [Bacteroidota bacterium]